MLKNGKARSIFSMTYGYHPAVPDGESLSPLFSALSKISYGVPSSGQSQ